MNSGTELDRMAAISRLAVECLRESLARDDPDTDWSGMINRLDVPPVRLSLQVLSDRAAAERIAEAIRRAIMKEVRA
jgi:hypothetical protein